MIPSPLEESHTVKLQVFKYEPNNRYGHSIVTHSSGYKEKPENPVGSHSKSIFSKVSQHSVVLPIEVTSLEDICVNVRQSYSQSIMFVPVFSYSLGAQVPKIETTASIRMPHRRWTQSSFHICKREEKNGEKQKRRRYDNIIQQKVTCFYSNMGEDPWIPRTPSKPICPIGSNSVDEQAHYNRKRSNNVAEAEHIIMTPEKPKRRKRYLPKVLQEAKPKKAPKPPPKSVVANSQEGKRPMKTYVRRKKLEVIKDQCFTVVIADSQESKTLLRTYVRRKYLQKKVEGEDSILVVLSQESKKPLKMKTYVRRKYLQKNNQVSMPLESSTYIETSKCSQGKRKGKEHSDVFAFDSPMCKKKRITKSTKSQTNNKQLRLLDINRENSMKTQGNQIVVFGGGSREIVPLTPIKKRHPRPKVDLDDETDRVWKLLMGKKTDGEDEDKANWWEEERNVFRGRADSFIARMHLVQGNRHFTPWKGSVVDSVVGVFLTQNVSDHLSSSAFMSLAAKFPVPPEEYHTSYMNLLEGLQVSKEQKKGKKAKGKKVLKEKKKASNWDSLRKEAQAKAGKRKKTIDTVDWEAVRTADVSEVSETIKKRGMHHMLAERIQGFLNRLVSEHRSIDLEWLRDVSPDKAKEYLLSFNGLGLKSVECVRLLTLHQLAFPVDTNVARIAVRLGWVPLQPLPESLQLHLLEMYPVLQSVQKYLWPRLCKLDQKALYELHYQLITFGKVFCTKSKPNCNACPMRGECRHFASAFASARLALPGTEKGMGTPDKNPLPLRLPEPLPRYQGSEVVKHAKKFTCCEPIIEVPASPEPESVQVSIADVEDAFYGGPDEDPEEIPTIRLNMDSFTSRLREIKEHELQDGNMSRALVALTAETASLPMPKLKNISQLRTEHQVYELYDGHPLLDQLEKRVPNDPCRYLLAIWTPGETADSIQPAVSKCIFQADGKLCDEETCLTCNSIKEARSQTVRGTILIPCRTALGDNFPLNGTYFQVNEVFADHASTENPIDVPRSLIGNLPRRTVYFGTSIPSIFKGLTINKIQECFWEGYVCLRGFDRKTRGPKPLIARLHFPASKMKAQQAGLA